MSLSESTNISLVKNIKDIYQTIVSTYDKYPSQKIHNRESFFNQGPNSKIQTNDPSVFIIREYYGTPSFLQTYIGEFNLFGSTKSSNFDDNKRLNSEIKNKLDLKLLEEGDYEGGSYIDSKGYKVPKNIYTIGYFGPWYIVDMNFDEIKERNFYYKNKKDNLSYETCQNIFKKY